MKRYIYFNLLMTLVLSGCAYTVQDQKNETILNQDYNISKLNLEINLLNAEKADHQTVVLGIVCSAHDYTNNMQNDIKKVLSEMDKSGILSDSEISDITISDVIAESNVRCAVQSFAFGKCLGEVSLTGKIKRQNTPVQSFHIVKTAIENTLSCEGAASSVKAANNSVLKELADKIVGLQ